MKARQIRAMYFESWEHFRYIHLWYVKKNLLEGFLWVQRGHINYTYRNCVQIFMQHNVKPVTYKESSVLAER